MNPFQQLIQHGASSQHSSGTFDWATVTSVSPITLVLDSSPGNPITEAIDNLGPALIQGSRVRVHIIGGRLYVYGNPQASRNLESVWTTVTSLSPLRVTIGGVATTVATTVGGLVVGDSVLVDRSTSIPTIVGRAGGPVLSKSISGLVYESGWSTYSTITLTWTAGRIHMDGLLRPTGTISGVEWVKACTLPAGVRPASSHVFPAVALLSGASVPPGRYGAAVAAVEIEANGGVYVYPGASAITAAHVSGSASWMPSI